MKTVLVADDDPLFREIVSDMLKHAGYSVMAAQDGQEAWELLEGSPADLAVLDLNMPRLDGIGLIKRIRADARFSEMPVLLLTIRDMVEDQVSGFERGADDYVTKPFDRALLLARIKVLERRILGR